MNITTSLPSAMFSSSIPDISISTSADVSVGVKIYFTSPNDTADNLIYDETLYADSDGIVELCELDTLVNPFAMQSLMGTLKIVAKDSNGSTATAESTVYYCSARVEDTASAFVEEHFLSRLDGSRLTAMGRLEYLHYFGTDTPTCTAHYSDGTSQTFTPETVGGGAYYTTIDVSPSKFAADGKTLIYYIVTAGSRTQEFDIDFNNPDCAPILAFTNCFGVQELAYCTGTLESSPELKYTQNYVRGRLQTQAVTEVRTLKADTGVLTFPMADWLQDLFTSREIYLVEMKDGNPNVSTDQMVITDCKQSYTNDHDTLPRFTFDYRRATRNTSVIPLHRAGRIFDTSFDFTFN